MKLGTLKAVGHNIADSLASGVGLMIGVHQTEIFGEAAATPEGYIEVDFLTGEASGGRPSPSLEHAIGSYAAALPDFCRRHGADISDFRQLSARFSGTGYRRFAVSIEDRQGRRSTDEYAGIPGKRVKVPDALGRLRPKRSKG